MNESLSIIGAFLEGLLSFFSPCVLPLLPVYLGYLSVNARTQLSDGSYVYDRKKVLLQTLCFILGISFAFVLLGLALTAVGQFFSNYQSTFKIIAGLLIIILALVQFGVIKISFLEKSSNLTGKVNVSNMNPWVAFVLGFLFSFTWTPCVGPALSGIALYASTSAMAYLYMLVYALGFVIPFIAVGFFTTEVLNFFKNRKKLMPILVKIGASILLIMGFYSFYQGITGLKTQQKQEASNTSVQSYTFTLNDLEGNRYRLDDFKGKPIVVNYFATWCGYCQEEIKVLSELAKEYPDVQFIGVLEVTNETDSALKTYLDSADLPYLILIDKGASVGNNWGVSGYPTTFFINSDYTFYGSYPGYATKDNFIKAIQSIGGTGK